MQGGQGGDRLEAKVVAIGPGIDLAVLTLDDDTFFAKRPPIPRGSKLPEITSRVLVQGYPIGGTTLSTTQGTVARIEYETYETGAKGTWWCDRKWVRLEHQPRRTAGCPLRGPLNPLQPGSAGPARP